MTTIRRIFSYDDWEDKDIHEFLESIPQRHRSKQIRMAIRNYISKNKNESIASNYENTTNEDTKELKK